MNQNKSINDKNLYYPLLYTRLITLAAAALRYPSPPPTLPT